LYRNARESDRRGILAILKASFSRIYAYYAAKSFESLENCLVATDRTGLTGVINWRFLHTRKEDILYLYWIAVRPDRRRNGIGAGLFRRAMKTSGRHAMIFAATEKTNRRARQMLLNSGFRLLSRHEMKSRYGKEASNLREKMNLMSWEDLYCRISPLSPKRT
jgi:ribosomal protein S18 acetylase RimI-like enzyme